MSGQKYFASGQTHFLSSQNYFYSGQDYFVPGQVYFLSSQKYFVPAQKHFLSGRKHLFFAQKDFVFGSNYLRPLRAFTGDSTFPARGRPRGMPRGQFWGMFGVINFFTAVMVYAYVEYIEDPKKNDLKSIFRRSPILFSASEPEGVSPRTSAFKSASPGADAARLAGVVGRSNAALKIM